MKKTIIFILLIFCVLTAFTQKADRELLLSLQDGENIIYGENCFTLTADKNSFTLITRLDGKYFIYENGLRKGPLSELGIDQLPSCPDQTNKLCALYDPANCGTANNREKFIQYDANYAMVISFKGKTYGPFMGVLQFMTNCDETKFVAVVMTTENKSMIIHSNGKTLEIEGTASWMKMSADGDQAIVGYIKAFDPSKMDMNNINMADFSKVTVTDLLGNKYGPFDSNVLRDSDFWFCRSGGPHWFLQQEETVLRDGKPWKTFTSMPSACEFWVNENGTQIGIAGYGDALNSDVPGVFQIPNALDISVVIKNGKQWIKWLSLENQKELVVYQRPL